MTYSWDEVFNLLKNAIEEERISVAKEIIEIIEDANQQEEPVLINDLINSIKDIYDIKD